MRVVNVDDHELEEGPGRGGFWFRAGPLGPALRAARIGAGLYQARTGVPIWPYHYHYPQEEWLYVLDGAPVLRDGSGRRPLRAGDLLCLPPGPRGAHTVEGPGHLVIFDGEHGRGPFVSVYPDFDKPAPVVRDPGDVACLPEGPAGGRCIVNRADITARVLLLWTCGLPSAVCYPQTRRWVLRVSPTGQPIHLRSG